MRNIAKYNFNYFYKFISSSNTEYIICIRCILYLIFWAGTKYTGYGNVIGIKIKFSIHTINGQINPFHFIMHLHEHLNLPNGAQKLEVNNQGLRRSEGLQTMNGNSLRKFS